MARNGSGTYVLPTGQPVSPGTVIQSSTFNAFVADIGNEMTNSFPRDGQAPMTAQAKFIDGTVTIPGVSFNSENASGMFRPGAGIVAFTASGVEVFRYNSSQRLMIGTTTDDGVSKLQVSGAASINGTLTISGLTTLSNGVAAPLGIGGAANATFNLDVLSPVAAAQKVAFRAAAGQSSTVHIAGNGSAPGIGSFDLVHDATGWAGIIQRSSSSLRFHTNNVEVGRFDATGNLLVGTTSAGGRVTATDAGTAGASTTLAIFGTVAAATAGTETRIHLTAGEGTARSTYIGGLNVGGANNAHSMTFGVSASASAPVERMRLTSNGLNIGNTDGTRPLEVTSDAASGRGVVVRGRSADNVGGLNFYSNDGTIEYGYVQGRVNGDMRYGARTDSGAHVFYTGAALAERLRVNNAGASITGTLASSGTITGDATTSFETGSAGGTLGQLVIKKGSSTRSGYSEYLSAAGDRQGYIGYSQSTASTDAGIINYVAGTHTFNGDVNVLASGGLKFNGHISRFVSAEQTCPSTSALITVAHGGTRVPDVLYCVLRCKTAEAGYAVGDEVAFPTQQQNIARDALLAANATNVYLRFDSSGVTPALRNLSTSTYTGLTAANWRVVLKAAWL